MQQGGTFSASGPGTYEPDCPFCQRDTLAPSLLKETSNFRIVTDHAPLLEGHLLITPRNHATCYGDVPASYDAELENLKDEVKRFFARYYAPVIYWEHGIFHQTVYHAHLHCFPLGEIAYDFQAANGLHERLIRHQGEIRDWHRAYGHYFYPGNAQHAALFAPRSDYYTKIIQEVLWPSFAARSQFTSWRSSHKRIEEGGPLIAAVTARWQQFQKQQEVENAD
ncbi:MAG TPA: HIT domain-containing protein [Ktedonobacteraceae bacterium]|nr:HIT domain-containing protein [Ktedonobacteraceae bacterium]